jgi:hypothetical protein
MFSEIRKEVIHYAHCWLFHSDTNIPFRFKRNRVVRRKERVGKQDKFFVQEFVCSVSYL